MPAAAALLLLLLTTIDAIVPTWKMQAATFKQRLYRGKLRTRTEGECRYDNHRACPMSDMTEKEVVSVYPGGKTQCMESSSPYKFMVYPGSRSNVLIYFQGGGACWNRFSTNILPMCNKQADEYERESFGVFERREPSNPYRDWTIVYVLFCSGDFHLGNTTTDNGPQRGAENTRAVLDWVKAQEFRIQNLVLMGGSAGSIGLQMYAGTFLTQLQPTNAAVVLDSCFIIDSHRGFYRDMFEKLEVCSNALAFQWTPTSFLLEKCMARELTMDDVLIETMRAFPSVTFATINSKTDWVQRLFYFAIFKSFLSPQSYYRKLSFQLREYAKEPNFVAYLINGKEHDFTDWHELYSADTSGPNKRRTSRTRRKDDVSLLTWIGQLPLHGNATIETQCSGPRVSRVRSIQPNQCDRGLFKRTTHPTMILSQTST